MKTNKIDQLNIVLIIISLFLAFQLPFELFSFSYAFLGPLHYLTEINWLKTKNYFVKDRRWVYFLGLLTALICLPMVGSELIKSEYFSHLSEGYKNSDIVKFLGKWNVNFLFIGLIASIGLIIFNKWWKITIGAAIAAGLGYFLMDNGYQWYLIIFSVFLPTLIHVYLFTALFMLYGALKSKSKWGLASVLALFVAIVVIVQAKIDPSSYVIGDLTKESYNKSSFSIVNFTVAKVLSLTPKNNQQFSLLSAAGIKIQIFVAFAYTYHYLNWFSKTSIIKWHKVNKKQFAVIATLWVLSVSLYWYDYRVGFIALLFLSMLHVLYEFPLNIVSMRGIFEELFLKKTAKT